MKSRQEITAKIKADMQKPKKDLTVSGMDAKERNEYLKYLQNVIKRK